MATRRFNVWKLLGLAGLVGVAASGALVARDERQRRSHSPDAVRARLRERHAEAEAARTTGEQAPTGRA